MSAHLPLDVGARHNDVQRLERELDEVREARRRAILAAVSSGVSCRAVARGLGLSPARVSQIVRGVRT